MKNLKLLFLGFVVALGSIFAPSAAMAQFSDPASSVEGAISAGTVDVTASAIYLAMLGILVSSVIVGAIIWALRKGIRPR